MSFSRIALPFYVAKRGIPNEQPSIGDSSFGKCFATKKLELELYPAEELRSIFDNDKQGHKYALWLHRYFHGDTTDVESLSNDELRNKVRKLKNVELSENKDWNDDLKISCGICSSTEDGQ